MKYIINHLKSSSRIVYYILLSVPFLLVVLYTSGLSVRFNTFHEADEVLHYMVSIKIYDQIMSEPVGDYLSSVTPLYYIINNAIGYISNNSLIAMRWGTMLASYVAAILFFLIIELRTGNRFISLQLSILYILSPYIFGSSFILLNDNIALMFLLAAIYTYTYSEANGKERFWVVMLFCSLSVLTRQTYLWVYIFIAFHEYKSGQYRNRLQAKIFMGLVSLAPVVFLIILWGGLTPPSHQSHHISVGLNIRAVLLLVALVGFYSLFLLPLISIKDKLSDIFKNSNRNIGILIIGIALVMLLYVFPLSKLVYGTDGFLLRVLTYSPHLNNSSIFLYVLLLTGIIAVNVITSNSWRNIAVLLFYAATLLPSAMMFQKYYDYFILLWIIYEMAPRYNKLPLQAYALYVLFVSYHVIYQVIL